MRTSQALSAALLVADAAAQASGQAQTVALDSDSNALTILTSHEYAVILEGQTNPFAQALLSIYPDGRVDLYRLVSLPREVPDVH